MRRRVIQRAVTLVFVLIMLMLLLVACETPTAPTGDPLTTESSNSPASSGSGSVSSTATPDLTNASGSSGAETTPASPTTELTSTPVGTFVVDSTADATDAVDDGICDDGSGNCTLRAAVMQASRLGVPARIIIPPGKYMLSIEPPTPESDDASSGDLDLEGDITIEGADKDTTVIDGGGIGRVLHIFEDSTVHISGVTIQNGNTTGGGGILNRGTLELADSAVSGNRASSDGGGIFNRDGTVTLNNSEITDNEAGGDGGGIFDSIDGTLMLDNSEITDNEAGDDGGGIFSAVRGTLTLDNSEITDNEAGNDGGGIFNANTLNITNDSVVNKAIRQ